MQANDQPQKGDLKEQAKTPKNEERATTISSKKGKQLEVRHSSQNDRTSRTSAPALSALTGVPGDEQAVIMQESGVEVPSYRHQWSMDPRKYK